MPQLPRVLVFDVNETMSDMRRSTGASSTSARLRATWFASMLQDRLGVAAAGAGSPSAGRRRVLA